jgi:hypothetical protein
MQNAPFRAIGSIHGDPGRLSRTTKFLKAWVVEEGDGYGRGSHDGIGGKVAVAPEQGELAGGNFGCGEK